VGERLRPKEVNVCHKGIVIGKGLFVGEEGGRSSDEKESNLLGGVGVGLWFIKKGNQRRKGEER